MTFTGSRAAQQFLFGIMAVGFGVCGAGAATDIKVPTEPVEKAAFEVLERTCARCHQEGRLVGRERPASGFGNVLMLEELVKNPKLVLAGNPYGSTLFKQIVDQVMPYDVMMEGKDAPSPNEADLKSLEVWIKSLDTKTKLACESHQFVSNKDVVGLIAGDLEKQSHARAKGTRYLTLTHLTNICTDDEAMKVYRQGAIKLVNSLSRTSNVVRLETIDPDQSIIRINIDDLGWDPADWDTVLALYPYITRPDTKLTSVLERATYTKLPYVRADWFAFTASRPPLYNKLLRLPHTFQALAHEQGADVPGNIYKLLAKRAAFQRSGVSRYNRLIERHPSRAGYFWTSYDFAGNRDRQNLFEYPLGPGGDYGFEHDGGETIFSLPNGFQGYYLNTAKGASIDKGPTTIVLDDSRKDHAVTNGISCMGCHDQGMKQKRDEVRATVMAGRAFPKPVKDAVAELYPEHEAMDRMIAEDLKRFTDAMVRAGIEPTLKLGGVEMINALSNRYEDDLDATLAAAELGLTKAEFAKAAEDADRRLKPMLRRLEQGVVPRDQFEAQFVELARALTDDELVYVNPAAAHYVSPSGASQKLVAAKPAHGIDLSLTSDRSVYQKGATPVFIVSSNRDCYLTLTNVDEKGVGTVLLPNKYQTNNYIRANSAVKFPADNAPFQYRMNDYGYETVIAVCSATNAGVDGIKHDFAKEGFTSVADYTRSVARAIVVEKYTPTVAAARVKATAAGYRAISRAAIKIEVK